MLPEHFNNYFVKH